MVQRGRRDFAAVCARRLRRRWWAWWSSDVRNSAPSAAVPVVVRRSRPVRRRSRSRSRGRLPSLRGGASVHVRRGGGGSRGDDARHSGRMSTVVVDRRCRNFPPSSPNAAYRPRDVAVRTCSGRSGRPAGAPVLKSAAAALLALLSRIGQLTTLLG